MSSSDLWAAASIDTEQELRLRLVTSARVGVQSVWSFLASADNEADFDNRQAMVAERIDAAVADATAVDPEQFVSVRDDVIATLKSEFAVLHAQRQAEATRKDAAEQLESFVAAEPDTRARVVAELARQAEASAGRADPFGREADRLSAEALDTEGPAHEGTDDDYHRGYGEGYGANQGKKDAINEYGQHSHSQHPYHRGWTDGYNDFETMSSDNLRSHMNEHHGGGHREGSFQFDAAKDHEHPGEGQWTEEDVRRHLHNVHRIKERGLYGVNLAGLNRRELNETHRRDHGNGLTGSLHTAKARCSFENWGQRCVLAAGHEGDHCRGFYNTPYEGTNKECACGHPERHVASLRTQAVGEPHTILTVQPKPASEPGALDGFEFVCSCGEKQSTSLSAEQARLMGARHVNFMNRNRGTASLQTTASTAYIHEHCDGTHSPGIENFVVGHEKAQRGLICVKCHGNLNEQPAHVVDLSAYYSNQREGLVHVADRAPEGEYEKVKKFVDQNWDGQYTTNYVGQQSDGSRMWRTNLHGPGGPTVHTKVHPDGTMTDHTQRSAELHTHSLGDTDEVDPWATTLRTNYHDPDDARVPVTVHQGVGEFDELGRHMHNQINDMREKGITNKGQPATLPCQHCGSDANFDKLYASFPSSYANYVCPNCNKETHYKPGYQGEDKKPDPDPGQGQMFGSLQTVAAQRCKHCGNSIEKRDDPTGQRGNAWAEVDAWGDDRDFQCGMNESRRHEPVNDPHGRPSVYSSISDAERVVIGAERSPATQRAQDAAIDRHRRLENERVQGEEREYADQHGHDVSWMTAEERNAHDQRMRELDTLVHFHESALDTTAGDLTVGHHTVYSQGEVESLLEAAHLVGAHAGVQSREGGSGSVEHHVTIHYPHSNQPELLAARKKVNDHLKRRQSALGHESDAPHGAHDDSGKHGDGSPGGAPGGDGGGDGKPPFPPADDAQQQAPGDQAGQLQPGAQVNVHYVMPDGTKGECPATVQTADGQTATLTYENGTFTATQQNGTWTDSKGATFTFDEGGADKPDPAKQEGPPKDSGGGDDSDPEKKKDAKESSLQTEAAMKCYHCGRPIKRDPDTGQLGSTFTHVDDLQQWGPEDEREHPGTYPTPGIGHYATPKSHMGSLHTADKPRGDMDRSVAFTILLDLLPGYGDSADDGGSTVTQFLNDWYADPSTDMYEFGRRWVGSHQAALAAGGNPYLPGQNPYSVGTPPPAPSSSGETAPPGEQIHNAPTPEITQPMTTRPRSVPRSNTMPAGAPTDMNTGNAGTGTTGV